MARHVAIIGAGPAGLTAAYLLTKRGFAVTVFESHPTLVGGISRTEKYKGFHFDIGGHRFFSKSQQVEDFWTEILAGDMLDRPRSSRIFYRGKFFSYPLKAFEALFRLGVFESILCVMSYAKARVKPIEKPSNFQEWVSNQFGSRLFNIFFKTYTEKVWGMKCTEISADWAAQRIKGLSLGSAVWNALGFGRGKVIKSLIDTFRYPRRGPGMMWEVCAEKVRAQGGQVFLDSPVTAIERVNAKWKIRGGSHVIEAADVISSAPLRELVQMIEAPENVKRAAAGLKYRDFITVMLILPERNLFSDNWIYIHDPGVNVGRIQNFKSWSPEMVPDENLSCYGLEYFCFEGDALWSMSDKDLIAMASKELEAIGLASASEVLDGCVVRQPKAYPVYDDSYASNVAVLKDYFGAEGVHLVGRNGMHKYNNQDHAMMTAMLTVENIAASRAVYDVWRVNQDAEYHESK